MDSHSHNSAADSTYCLLPSVVVSDVIPELHTLSAQMVPLIVAFLRFTRSLVNEIHAAGRLDPLTVKSLLELKVQDPGLLLLFAVITNRCA